MANRLAGERDRRIILIVEDDEVLRMVLHQEFVKNGFYVREAENGQAGIASFVEMPPNIIITDLMMPVMDGISFIAAVRKTNDTVPIIAMSAVMGDRMGEKAVEAGANQFCIKPIATETLLTAIKDYLPASFAEQT